jgi:hypothetical protein
MYYVVFITEKGVRSLHGSFDSYAEALDFAKDVAYDDTYVILQDVTRG